MSINTFPHSPNLLDGIKSACDYTQNVISHPLTAINGA